MLAIAMTLVAGAAAWGFVRSQAANSEGALQTGANNTNELLDGNFGVVDMYLTTSGSTSTATFWVYNTGSLTFQAFSARLYGPSGTINLLYNFTQATNGAKTDYVYDLSSSVSTRCKTAATCDESPSVSGTTVKTTDAQIYTLTIPASATNCPSFGYNWVSGTTYSVVVTGIYGNTATHSQTD